MGTVEVVIRIPEKYIEGSLFNGIEKIMKAVREGTVLPKGHGRLGDLDTLYGDVINGIKAGNYEEGYEEYGHINDMDDVLETIKYADVVIEADKEAENDTGRA